MPGMPDPLFPQLNYDWPVPRGPARPADVAVGSQPLGSYAGIVIAAQYDLGFNLWTNPDLPKRRNPLDWVDFFKLPLQQRMPPGKVELPGPRNLLPKLGSVSLLTWTDSFKLPLQQRMNPGKAEFPGARNLLPKLGSVSLLTWTDSFKLPLQQRMNPGKADLPGSQNLLAKAFTPVTQLTWTQSLFPPRATAQPLPENQFDWPNPIRRRVDRPPSDWIFPTPIALYAPVIGPAINCPANPVLPIVRRWDWTDSFKLPLQTVLPFNQEDWPVPKGPRPIPQDWRDSFKLPLQSALPPGTQLDWPNPQRRARRNLQDWIEGMPLALQPVVTFPKNQTDWPNPILRPVLRQDWIQSTNTALNAPVIGPAASNWANPIAPRPVPQDWRDSFKLPLQTVVPENQYDWPVPRGPRRNPQDWIAPSNIALLTGTAATLPIRQSDWPVPKGAAPRNDLTWLQSGLGLLTEEFEPASNELGNPDGPQPRRFDWIAPSNMALLTAVVVPPPPAQYDWPVPRAARSNPQDWVVSSSVALLTAPVDTFDLGFNLWALPERGRLNPQDWILPSNIALQTTPAATPPIGQFDWPVPRGPRRNPQDWSDSFKLPLQQTLPPVQRDFPNPTLARRNPQDWIAPSNITLQTTLAGKPKLQSDWPVPPGPRIGRQDWTLSTPIALYAQVVAPAADAWSNPNLRVVQRQDWIQAAAAALRTPTVLPHNQYDWPDPILRPVQRQGWVFPTPIALYAQVVSPAADNWANPNLRVVQRQDWIQAAAAALRTFVQPPFKQTDWPLPRGPRIGRQGWELPTPISLKAPVIGPAANAWVNPLGQRPRGPQDWILGLPLTLRPQPNPPVFDAGNALKNERLRMRDLSNKNARVRFLKNERWR